MKPFFISIFSLLFQFSAFAVVQTPYAIDATTDRIVRASSAKKDGRHYECLQCGSELILRQGAIKAAHFAHKGDSDGGCGGGVETGEHLFAKTLLLEHLHQWKFQERCSDCPGLLKTHTFPAGDEFTGAIEFAYDRYKVDMMVLRQGTPIAALEVRHTHPVDPEKRDFFNKTHLPIIEISAIEVIEAYDYRTFTAQMLDHERRCEKCEADKKLKNRRPCLQCKVWSDKEKLHETERPPGHKYPNAYVCDRCKSTCPSCQKIITQNQRKDYVRCYSCNAQASFQKKIDEAVEKKDISKLNIYSKCAKSLAESDLIRGKIRKIEQERKQAEAEEKRLKTERLKEKEREQQALLEKMRNFRQCAQCKNSIEKTLVEEIESLPNRPYQKVYVCKDCKDHCPSCKRSMTKKRRTRFQYCFSCKQNLEKWQNTVNQAIVRKNVSHLRTLLDSPPPTIKDLSQHQETLEKLEIERKEEEERLRLEEIERLKQIEIAQKQQTEAHRRRLQAQARVIVDVNRVHLNVPYAEKERVKAYGAQYLGPGGAWTVGAQHIRSCQRWVENGAELTPLVEALLKKREQEAKEKAREKARQTRKRNRETIVYPASSHSNTPKITDFFDKKPRT